MRVFIYSHDTYGLGHLRRCMIIAKAIVEKNSQNEVLVATGSPRATAFQWQARCGKAVLPAILKQSDGTYRARDGERSLGNLLAERSAILCQSFRDFQPDVVLVDHAPLGVENELAPLIAVIEASRNRPLLALGMREIVDDVENVRKQWSASGADLAIQNAYDRVFVYGSDRFLTTATELGVDQLTDRFGQPKTSHVGYIAREGGSPLAESGRILVTVGGGGDGHILLRKFLRFLRDNKNLPWAFDVVSGPLLSERRFAAIKDEIADLRQDVELIRFDSALEKRLRAATGVISMAGYNTVMEILSAGRPALLVPRDRPRREQLIRAQRLATACRLHWCRSQELNDDVFMKFLGSLAEPFVSPVQPDFFRGTQNLVNELTQATTQASGFVEADENFPGGQLRESAR